MTGMTLVGDQGDPTGRIPYLHGVIPGARGNTCAIGRPRHRVYNIGMTLVGDQGDPASRIPYLYGVVITGRGDARAIGRPRYYVYSIIMTIISKESPSPIGCMP